MVSETKREAALRWKREGRIRKVVADRKRWTLEFFADDLPKAEAEERAFERALEEYPPLPPPPPKKRGRKKGSKSQGQSREPEVGGGHGVPPSWGTIPESASFDAEVEWVHQNMVLVIEERGSREPEFHWDRAQKAAPSHGARNLMQFAATNRAGFMNMLQRVKPGAGGEDDIVRREKVKIEEIKRILEELRGTKEPQDTTEETDVDSPKPD